MKPLNGYGSGSDLPADMPPAREPYDSTLTYRFTALQEHVIARALRLLLDSGQPLTKYERDAIGDLDRFYEVHS